MLALSGVTSGSVHASEVFTLATPASNNAEYERMLESIRSRGDKSALNTLTQRRDIPSLLIRPPSRTS
jgi:hypothetical protein